MASTPTQVHNQPGGRPVKRATLNVPAGSTDAAGVAAVTGWRIRVLAVLMVSGGVATTVQFNSKGAGAGTPISPNYPMGVNGVFPAPYNPVGWWETNPGEGLTVTTGAGSTTAIQVIYCLAQP